MGQGTKGESQSGKRDNLRCDLSAHIFSVDDRRPIRCVGTSVSRNSLGVISMDELPEQSQVVLVLKEKGITLDVMSCRADPQRQSVFHITLQTSNPAYNLQTSMEADGIGKPALSKNDPPKPAGMTFDLLREAIAHVHTPDQSILKTAGLNNLQTSKRAYPIQHAGQSLIVLLPLELKPQQVAKLSDDEARKGVVIMQRKRAQFGDSRWVMVWPEAQAS